MPGFAGIVGKKPSEERHRDVAIMIDTMRHDPSYVSGVNTVDECSLTLGWTAHPESFAQRCSMHIDEGGIVIAFVGECFLPGGSRQVRSPCTELLDLYRRLGAGFVAELNGLFSGVLVDRHRQRAWIFNDRYGAERIYCHVASGQFYFASEAKALLSVLPSLRGFDEEGVAQYLAYGSTWAGRTLFRGVSLLPGGSLWSIDPDGIQKRGRYFDPAEWEAQSELSTAEFEEAFVETAREAVPKYASGDGAIGVSITGGLDTRMIMACLPPAVSGLVCYTYGAEQGDTLDVRIGRRVAHSMGLEHHTLRVESEFIRSFGDFVDKTVYVTDGTLGALGAHEIYLSAKARELSAIRLTGNFGSELLRGMSTRKPLNLVPEFVNPGFLANVTAWRSMSSSENPLTRAAFEEVPLHLFGGLAAARSCLTVRTPYLDNELVRLAYRAPAMSRRSPDSALRLISTGDSALRMIPTDRGYSCASRSPWSVLRRLFCEVTFKLDYLDKEGLPGSLSYFDVLSTPLARIGVLGLHKFLPYRRWFQREFSQHIGDVIDATGAREHQFFDQRFLKEMGEAHSRSSKNLLREINAVLTIDAVERTLIAMPPRPAVRSLTSRERTVA